MHPDLPFAVARVHQHELQRRAEVGRRAAEFKTSKHRRIQFRVPRLEFGRLATTRRVARA
jgi:hypothetical protein